MKDEKMDRLIVVCDLEATCWNDRPPYTDDDMEIIEIGCALITPDGKELDRFSTFVKPVREPILSPFCTELTGITQQDVDAAPGYIEAMQKLDEWVNDRAAFWVSWGNYDYHQFQCLEQRSPSGSRFLCMPHANIKKAWAKTVKGKQKGLLNALAHHGLEFQGSHHRGLDDARNIARMMPYIDAEKIAQVMNIPVHGPA